MDFLVLFECKRHASPVKREHVQVLHAKMQSTGAQKAVLVAASGFQSGALHYARAHGIACVRLVDDTWTYLSRTLVTDHPTPSPTGIYTGYVIATDEDDYSFDCVTCNREKVREVLLDGQSPI
jgi:restriction system protein